jgi:hypothetical protein
MSAGARVYDVLPLVVRCVQIGPKDISLAHTPLRQLKAFQNWRPLTALQDQPERECGE